MKPIRPLPSIRTLSVITNTPEDAKRLRSLLESSIPERWDHAWINSIELTYPRSARWLRSCFNWPPAYHIRLTMADELLKTYGVEVVRPGRGRKSPAIEYCNPGDPYAPTLMLARGRYQVGCVGDIVERGNYS